MAALSIAALGASACAIPPPYEAEPQSIYQWQRRQDGIQQREAERQRLCAIMNKDTDRYERDCTRPGDPVR
ncbi:MAG: hypothetical protein KKA16_09400 [Alphaproteobacteria bacterium]|nr:hypothetical protein [Alphaproteobacteria bacterium]MBU2379500.1 hypothetical protein [Alphaproteobacteria bacterium]